MFYGREKEVAALRKIEALSAHDAVMDAGTLDAKIRRGIVEYEQGKALRMQEGESSDEFLARLLAE